MPPMATPPVKRKWSDLQEDEADEKQVLMDLCAAKLRYVNPPRPPKRRTEVPLLRSVLIVNAMKHLSSEMKTEKPMDFSSEDLTVDPGHFEGLPPLSELLTDIMLDPQPFNSPSDLQSPMHQHHQPQSSFLNWPSSGSPHYSPLTPVQPSVTSYVDPESIMETGEEEKTVHNLLPCTSVLSSDLNQVSSSWEMATDSSIFDSFLSESSFSQTPSDALNSLSSDLSTFQPSRNPLPSFTSIFDSTHGSASYRYTELSQSPAVTTSSLPVPMASQTNMITSSINSTSTEESVGSTNFSESELEILAMTLSAKLPTLSIEELVHALPQSASLSQQMSQTASSSFFVPSTLQATSPSADANPATNNQCASYCRKDQPPPNVDDGSMVRVLVNL